MIEALHRRPLLAIFLLATLMALAFQGSRGLWDPDEGRYSNVALQMLKSGDPVTLYRHPASFHFTKPPLTYWAMAASVKTFGRNEWAVRLPMALAFVLSALLVFRLGRLFVPERPWLPALIFVASPYPFLAAYTVNTDTVLAATEILAVLCYAQARFDGGSPRWLDAMWAAFGLAFLTKGPPGLLPLLAVLAFHLSHRGSGVKLLRPIGLLAFALIGFTWYALVIERHPGLLQYFLGHEVVARIASEEMDRNPQWYGPLIVYLPVLVLGLLPWLPLAVIRSVEWRFYSALLAYARKLPVYPLPVLLAYLVAAIPILMDLFLHIFRKIRSAPRAWSAASSDARFLWLWLALPLLVFCLARSRLPLYVLPLAAPLSLLVARALTDWRPGRGWAIAIGGWVLLLIGFKGALALTLPGDGELARGLRRNNAANVSAQLRPLLPGPPREIVFVEDKTRYGLNLYLDADIARVGFKPEPKKISDARFDMSLAQSFAQKHGGRIYLVPRPHREHFLAAAREAGVAATELGVMADERGRADKDRVVYTLRGDFPPR